MLTNVGRNFSFPLEDRSSLKHVIPSAQRLRQSSLWNKLLMNLGDRNAQNIGQVYYTIPSFV